MTIDQALGRLGLARPRGSKLSCPQHEDKTASLHLYDDHFYCFACGQSGDGYGLIAWYTGEPVGRVLRNLSSGGERAKVTVKGRRLQQRQKEQRRVIAATMEPAFARIAELYVDRRGDDMIDAVGRWIGMQYDYECYLWEAETGQERETVIAELEAEMRMALAAEEEIAAHAKKMAR